MSASEKLDCLLKHLKLNAKTFSERLGYARPQLMYDIQKGKTKRISSELADKITSVFPEINPSWLLADKGPMLNTEEESTPTTADKELLATYIPLIPADAFAGPIARLLETGVTDNDCRSIISPVAGAEMAIPVSGDSMEPTIHDGSILYIARINDRAFIPWGNIMVVDTENGALVKELYPVDNDNSVLQARSLNAKYPPFNIPKSSIRGIYRVLGIAKFHTTL